ncbi:MAG TPA: YnbE family lipoprotein [Kiloniellaceae bacterium]
MTCFGGRQTALGGMLLCIALAACTPTVQVAAPKEPITINLNVKLDAEVRVKIEEQASEDIQNNPDIF